jgi:hypothetical protein
METDQQQDEDDVVNDLSAWLRSMYNTVGNKTWSYFAKPLSAAIVSARQSACERAGFRFEYPVDSPGYGKLWIDNEITLVVDFSPAYEHVALAYHRENWRGAGWWINGRAMDVPCDEDGFPMCDYSGRWIDEDTFQIVVGLPDHPLTDPRARDQLSELRGLFFVNARTYKTMLVLPRDDERWELLSSRRDGKKIHIYAHREEVAGNHIARTVEF